MVQRYANFTKSIDNNYDIKSGLQILRCFGPLIREIDVECVHINYRCLYKYVLIYIQKYCNNSLTKFFIEECGYLKIFKKPFSRLERLEIRDCVMKMKTDWIKRIFPSVKVLKIKGLILSLKSEYFAYHFPQLEHYGINYLHHFPIKNMENFTTMFRLNSQLKILHINFFFFPPVNANFLQNVIENFQNLEILTIETPDYFFNDYDNDIIFFSNVKQFNIHVHMAKGHKPLMIPFSFGKLESFSICCQNEQMNEHFYSFIDKHPTIKFLKLKHDQRTLHLSNILIERLERSLPLLAEVEFKNYILLPDQVISIIRKFKSLKILSFTNFKDYEIELLQNRLDIVWSLTKTNHLITIQRQN